MKQRHCVNALVTIAILAVSGCSSAGVQDIEVNSFSLDNFSAGWVDSSENAGDINFRGERVGDLCGFDSVIQDWGATQLGRPQLVLRDGDYLSEQAVFSSRYRANDGQGLDELFGELTSELDRCSQDDFANSTDNGILRSESIVNDVEQISDTQGITGVEGEWVLIFDYVRVEKRSVLNTNNEYTDDDEYESSGRVIVIGANDSVLLVTSAGRSWENFGKAPSISDQNRMVSDLLVASLG